MECDPLIGGTTLYLRIDVRRSSRVEAQAPECARISFASGKFIRDPWSCDRARAAISHHSRRRDRHPRDCNDCICELALGEQQAGRVKLRASGLRRYTLSPSPGDLADHRQSENENYALAARAAREYFFTAFSIPGPAFFRSSRDIAGVTSTAAPNARKNGSANAGNWDEFSILMNRNAVLMPFSVEKYAASGLRSARIDPIVDPSDPSAIAAFPSATGIVTFIKHRIKCLLEKLAQIYFGE